jgi:hypothetical protein
MQGQIETARPHLQRAITLARLQGPPHVEARAHVNLGIAAAWQGDCAASRAEFQIGLDMLERLDSRMNLTHAAAHAALALLDEGDASTAQAVLQRAAGAPFSKYTALYHLAQACVLAATDRLELAQSELALARSLLDEQAARLSDPGMRASFLNHPHNRLIQTMPL